MSVKATLGQVAGKQVSAASAAGAFTALVTYVLETFVFRGAPVTLTAILPAAVGWVVHTAGTWLAPHPSPPAPAVVPPTPGNAGAQ